MDMAELFCTGIYLKAVGKEEGREKRYANNCEQDRAFETAGCLRYMRSAFRGDN